MAVEDSAVGAILEIPAEALRNIAKAERGIWALHDASKKAAAQVYGDFSKRMPMGIDVFIQKLKEATGVMDAVSGKTIDINVNTNAKQAAQQTDDMTKQIKNDLDSLSASVQQLAASFNFSDANQSARDLKATFNELERLIKNAEKERGKLQTDDPQVQKYNNLIASLREFIALKKQSDEQSDRRIRKEADTTILAEQKNLLTQILQLQKDINSEELKQTRSQKLGHTIPQEDIDRLDAYRNKVTELSEAYIKLRDRVSEMSEAGQKKFNVADINAELAMTREQTNAQEKLNQALQQTAKLTSETKLKSAGISSREESVYQNELVAVYQQMIKLIKMKGDMETQIAAQGTGANADQVNYLKTLGDEYARLENTLAKVSGKYTEIDRQSKSNFENSKLIQEAENAAKLADALQKAAEAADKRRKAEAKTEKADLSKDKAEYKRVLALIEQTEKAQRKLNEALGAASLPVNLEQQIRNSLQSAEAALNTLYQRRNELGIKRGAELADIQRQQEVKKGQAAIAEHEKAEKEKTRISKQEATDRYNEEMRQARLQNQALTAQGKQQRMSINDAKEQRAIELAQQRQREIERLRKEIDALDKKDVNYQKDLDRLNQRINELLGTTQRRISYTYEEAAAMAKNAKTLREYETAYKALKDAMATTDVKDPKWKEMNKELQRTKKHIDDIKRKMGEFQKQSRNASDVVGQLQGRIAAAFSISAINGFIRKMTNVRAQFELQRVALGAILQDKDKADKIFLQVQQMALQSPFSIMQLERATKQIAAFGFEADKLKPTLKMLADMSAGLGVEIDRLVLVMGHLKARNYLEGCLGLGTLVKMYDGSVKRVEGIEQGEYIMGDDDTPRTVRQIIRGREQMYKVSYADGSFHCNEKHILTLFNVGKNIIEDIYVLDYLKAPENYKGVKRTAGRFEYFDITVVKDVVDNYYGFVIDGNRRFQLGDGVVTHNTMVRQFTNAGFNVLGELAKYYSELEGRMVSVAEVQTRVKKKMVEFGDVEEVLKRVTSAGGMFYDMQKKQSDSLWGQMQRITDAYDLMLNEIGKDNQNMISKALTAIRSLINSWRTLAPVIKDVGYIMAAAFAAKGLQTLIIGMDKFGKILVKLPALLKAVKTGIIGMNVAWSTTGIGLLLTALLTAVEIFRGAQAEAKALKEELNRIGDESVKNLNESIVNFKSLADTLSDTTKSYEERNNALQELKRVYHDILPQEKLEWDYINGLNGDYKELTKSIVDYYSAKEYQHKYEAVLGSKQAKDVTEELERTFRRMNKEGALGMIFPDSQIKDWANKVATEINTGKIPASVEALAERTKEIFGENINISAYMKESYGKADFTDVVDKAEKVRKEVDDLSLSSVHAENAIIGMNEAFANMDSRTATQKLDELGGRAKWLADEIERLHNTALTADPLKNVKIEQYRQELDTLTASFKSVEEARAKIIAQEFKEKVESEIKVLTDLLSTWWKNKMAMQSLEMQGEKNSKAYRTLEIAQKRIIDSVPDLEEKMGVKVPFAMLQSAQTTYELQQQLNILSEKAFPKVAAEAKTKMSDVELAVLDAKGSMDSFLTTLQSILPENLTNGFRIFGQTLGWVSDEAAEAGESVESIYSDLAKKRVNQFGADMSEVNKIIDKNLTRGETAKNLRLKAEELRKTLKSFDTATSQAEWLKLEGKTEQGIAQMRKDVQAIEALAVDLDGVNDKTKKGASGKDPVLEMWKKRNDAVKRYYDGAEKARKNLSEVGTKEQQIYSFTKLWSELGLNEIKGLSLNELLTQGFDPDLLKYQYVEALKILKKAIPPQYADLKKEIEKQIASESVEIQFKIAEGEREKLQQSVTDMFDNYALTKELSKLGVDVDLTYSVGGKPTTLADIRDEYDRLMIGFADKSEEVQKIIKKMGEDLQKKELDNRKQQLNNYVKYLVESMSERAQIEIKTFQDVNKIREDETLDSFSKEQSIMQRRKKMYEDLSKTELDRLKSSDVYISVFKDLESASKEQLQYVINKLRELQSTFRDLSPAQVKSIANEMKKIEDALADKDSIKNLSVNLKAAIDYAKKRNVLLREQTTIQDSIEGNNKMLAAAEQHLYKLELRRESIQDKSSDEWSEANDEVKRQQDIVKELQDKIKELEKELGLVTEQINKGAQAWAGFKSGLANVRNIMNQVKGSLDSVFDGLDSLGAINDGFRDTYESITEIIGGLDTFIGGLETVDIMKPFSILTGSIKSIGGLLQTIGGAFGIGDKKKERQIQNLVDKVDTLDKSYQRLEKSIEAAYTLSDYNAGYNQMQSNLAQQRAYYNEMISLEESKKKSDSEKVKEYREKLQEIADAEEELRKSRHETYGSTDDVWSEANNWVDAWLDAYKEAGTGIDSLNESWDEFYENLVKKQATSAIVSKRMEKFISQINDAIEKSTDEYGYVDAFKEIGERFKKEFGDMNQQLIDFFNYAGITGGNGDLILSDLQKGIQNITEPQAAAIEAYLNSMRFAVFRHTEQLDTLISAIQMQYGSGAENPVVTELKGIRGVLDSIDRRLGSVIKSGTGKTYIQVG